MKFLVDQQLPRSLCRVLVGLGCEAVHVKEFKLEEAGDRDIWREARRLGAIIITKDEDFSLIISRPADPQVVWVRVGNCSNARLFARIEEVWPILKAELEAGARLVEIR